jgi:hypothetical protein
MPIDAYEIDKRFTYHEPKDGNQIARYDRIRAAAREFAVVIAQNAPTSREQSLALTAAQDAMMWANAAIACHEE